MNKANEFLILCCVDVHLMIEIHTIWIKLHAARLIWSRRKKTERERDRDQIDIQLRNESDLLINIYFHIRKA